MKILIGVASLLPIFPLSWNGHFWSYPSFPSIPKNGWREKNYHFWAINLCTNLLQNLEMHKMGFTKLLCNNILWQILDVWNRNNNKKYSRPKTSFLIENVEIERQTSRQSVAQSLEQIRSHKRGLEVYEVACNRLQILKDRHLEKFFFTKLWHCYFDRFPKSLSTFGTFWQNHDSFMWQYYNNMP